jgi:hypothetical protein
MSDPDASHPANIHVANLPVITAGQVMWLRNVAGLGTHSIHRARTHARDKFGGDMMTGIGYVELGSLAVRRGRSAAEHERNLQRDARSWAEDKRTQPEWAERFPAPALGSQPVATTPCL